MGKCAAFDLGDWSSELSCSTSVHLNYKHRCFHDHLLLETSYLGKFIVHIVSVVDSASKYVCILTGLKQLCSIAHFKLRSAPFCTLLVYCVQPCWFGIIYWTQGWGDPPQMGIPSWGAIFFVLFFSCYLIGDRKLQVASWKLKKHYCKIVLWKLQCRNFNEFYGWNFTGLLLEKLYCMFSLHIPSPLT